VPIAARIALFYGAFFLVVGIQLPFWPAWLGAHGMSAEQIGEKLRCRCHSVLVQLCRQGRLQRHKAGRCFLYLAADAQAAQSQLRHLQPDLPAEIAVFVLAAFIRNPQASWKQLAKSVSQTTGLRIDSGQIQALFHRHGLKKTT